MHILFLSTSHPVACRVRCARRPKLCVKMWTEGCLRGASAQCFFSLLLSDLLSAYSVNGGAAFGSYTEMPGDLHKEADEDFDGFVGGDFDAFKNGDAADVTRIRQPTTISATLTGSDPADGTEAVLNSLPDLRFMLDRGRTWPMHGVTVV